MINTYPFASGSQYTASYAISASWAPSASRIPYVETASLASQVLFPVPGEPGRDICLITYQQYLQIINNPGVIVERCIAP